MGEKALRTEPYRPALGAAWDRCVLGSRNGTFLHERGFMDYHADRFVDASVVVSPDGVEPVAVMPANRAGEDIVSHGGLTYGGLVATDRLSQVQCLDALRDAGRLWAEGGARKVVYKPVPHLLHRRPMEADLYALHRLGARLVRREASCVVDLQAPADLTKGRKWSVKKAADAGIDVAAATDVVPFHALLTDVLRKHGRAPVHSVAELRLLMERFPEGIRLMQAMQGDDLLAAALVFDHGHVLHTQYMANSDAGRDAGALDFLVSRLMAPGPGRRWLSFGISTEQGGQVLNEGLMAYKEGFGGRTVVHDTYEWDLPGA